MTPHYVTFSNIIIDDIVLWNGQTFMGTLGGSGTHALVGMRVWSDRLGFVATIGSDFEPAHREQLERMNLDLRGVIQRGDRYATARAWQLFEPDERRIEIMRTSLDDFLEFTPQFEEMPEDYVQAQGVHIQWGRTFEQLDDLLQKLKQANPAMTLVWEPVTEHLTGTPQQYRQIFQQIDLISPDRDEAQSITGQTDPDTAVKTMLAWGVPLVAMRMGADGSVVHTAGGERWKIPAVPPAKIVDVTGAGDAYCGGFLVGLGQGHSPVESALRAAVSASFALEQFGVPQFSAETTKEAQRRLAWARERVEQI